MYERSRKKLISKKFSDQNVLKVFMSVLANYALKNISQDAVPLYESGFFGRGSKDLLDLAYKQTLIDLRPEMIGLCELAPEGSIPTTVGNKYGDIYETQYEVAKKSKFNTGEVPELYYTHMKPVMQMVPAPKL